MADQLGLQELEWQTISSQLWLPMSEKLALYEKWSVKHVISSACYMSFISNFNFHESKILLGGISLLPLLLRTFWIKF